MYMYSTCTCWIHKCILLTIIHASRAHADQRGIPCVWDVLYAHSCFAVVMCVWGEEEMWHVQYMYVCWTYTCTCRSNMQWLHAYVHDDALSCPPQWPTHPLEMSLCYMIILTTVFGAKTELLSTSVETSHTSSTSPEKLTEPLTRSLEKQPRLTTQRNVEHNRGNFEEGKPAHSASFRTAAEPGRPVTESMLYNLVAAAAFPAAPADMVLDVLANNTSVMDARHLLMQGTNTGERYV